MFCFAKASQNHYFKIKTPIAGRFIFSQCVHCEAYCILNKRSSGTGGNRIRVQRGIHSASTCVGILVCLNQKCQKISKELLIEPRFIEIVVRDITTIDSENIMP